MILVTSEQMRDLDRRAMTEGGMPGIVLMENAGRAVFEEASAILGSVRGKRITIFAGTGNNGGDGFVAARYLRLAGARVRLTLSGDSGRISGDARTAFGLLAGFGIAPGAPFETCDLAVDAVLGTGLSGSPRKEAAAVIERMASLAGAPVLSVDIPSGLESDTGRAPGAAVRATRTVTFVYPKIGLFLGRGPELAGKVVCSEIGFPWDSLGFASEYRAIGSAEARACFAARPRDSHKGDFGHILVVGGSVGMPGAPALAGRAALRSGAGLVSVACPSEIQAVVAGFCPELMSLAAANGGTFTSADAEAVMKACHNRSVLCAGMGLGRSEQAAIFVREILRATRIPAVVDADALWALAGYADIVRGRTGPTILTPHPGECAHLLGCGTDAIQADRIAAVRDLARQYGAIAVLKGASTLVCDGRRESNAPLAVWVNTSGNPGMATGGSGDVLAGAIAGAMGQCGDPLLAACAGVWIHGRAGDLAARQCGQAGLVAGDIAEGLPLAIMEVEEAV